jgi:hypothetical protein
MPDAKLYKKAEYSQRLSITNGLDNNLLYHKNRDDVFSNAPTDINPNRRFPWAVSGGMHGLTGWFNKTAVYIPPGEKVKVFEERVEAGARHPLPRISWSFPDGTKFADILMTYSGPFEIRVREKTNGSWRFRIAHRDENNRPRGYTGLKMSCAECHGSKMSEEGYGIQARGSDETISWTPLIDGTYSLDWSWPLEAYSKYGLIKP